MSTQGTSMEQAKERCLTLRPGQSTLMWLLLAVLSLPAASCLQRHPGEAKSPTRGIPLILPLSLEGRRAEFRGNIDSARQNIRDFAELHGWQELVRDEFLDSVMIFDDKKQFDRTLLRIAGADTTLELPETYCAALENRVLIALTPEYYTRVYPEGIEHDAYVRLLTHEIAHRLHVRILDGDEEAMGPVWFYEGFATYAADQFSETDLHLEKEEMAGIMRDPERGSYVNYHFIFSYFADRIPLPELIRMARDENFNETMISLHLTN